MNSSCRDMWREWLAFSDALKASDADFSVWQYRNNIDADTYSQLILSGEKRAASRSLWDLKLSDKSLPEAGKFNMVVDGQDDAQCIIRTTRVDVVPFHSITEEHIKLEGFDTIDKWRTSFENYCKEAFKNASYSFSDDMPVVCARFAVVYPLWAAD